MIFICCSEAVVFLKVFIGLFKESKMANELNKTALKEMMRCYQAWNKAELKRRMQEAGMKTPEQKWKEYLAIMEFGMSIRPQPGKHEQEQKIQMLTNYYQRILCFEKWRHHEKIFQHCGALHSG
jgi:hypothetical protein